MLSLVQRIDGEWRELLPVRERHGCFSCDRGIGEILSPVQAAGETATRGGLSCQVSLLQASVPAGATNVATIHHAD